MPKQFVAKWLIDMLADGPYRDEREVKAEQQEIRRNGRAEVDKIWDAAQKKLAPPPVAPLPPPDWGNAPPPPPPPSFQESTVSTARGNSPFVETPSSDPGIGPVSRLAEPLAEPPVPAPIPAPVPPTAPPNYWSRP
jgi:hypothetical protein